MYTISLAVVGAVFLIAILFVVFMTTHILYTFFGIGTGTPWSMSKEERHERLYGNRRR